MVKGYVLEFGYYSNPYSKDSDGDGYDDGKEVLAKTDPNNPFSRPMPNITLPKTGPGAPPAPDYVETISKLTDKLMEKEVENQELSQTNAVLEENLAELNSTNQVLVSRVNDLESQVGKLKSKVQDLDTQVVALTKENQDISMQLQNVSHERDNLANDIVVKDEQLEKQSAWPKLLSLTDGFMTTHADGCLLTRITFHLSTPIKIKAGITMNLDLPAHATSLTSNLSSGKHGMPYLRRVLLI